MFRFLNFKKIDTYVHRMIIQNTNIGKIDLVIKLILQDQLLCFMIVKNKLHSKFEKYLTRQSPIFCKILFG